jgi:hypothetical protein
MRRLTAPGAVLLTALTSHGCWVSEYDQIDDSRFPLAPHRLYPLYMPWEGQIAAGAVTGLAPAQPIPFSHEIHAGALALSCEYCHTEARRSIYAGVPPLQTCMGCHAQVKKDNPDVQLIHQAWCGKPECAIEEDAYGQPVAPPEARTPERQKVHDLPDYVYFAHKRHVRAGVQCTECHGQIATQGAKKPGRTAEGDIDPLAPLAVQDVMIRETTLQMGWCLDCHANHPSVDQNYGDNADLRRAELKDCWTCHK